MARARWAWAGVRVVGVGSHSCTWSSRDVFCVLWKGGAGAPAG